MRSTTTYSMPWWYRDNTPERLTLMAFLGLVFTMLWVTGDLISETSDKQVSIANNVWRGIYITALNFVVFEYVIRYLSFKRILKSLLVLAASFAMYTFGLFLWREFGYLIGFGKPLIFFDTTRDAVCYNFSYSVLSWFVFGIGRHIYDFTRLKQRAQLLLIEKQAAELRFLKAQTNPHFLFNTLNNIYALAKDNAHLSQASILRLSEMLRFMLYETNVSAIPVGQEVQVIKDYIELEKLRYDDSLKLDFQCQLHDPNQMIPPLLLIPLVENAFKHGASETRQNPFITLRLNVSPEQLEFEVRNSISEGTSSNSNSGGIGLANLKRQLELLFRVYRLETQQSASTFTALLTINLMTYEQNQMSDRRR